ARRSGSGCQVIAAVLGCSCVVWRGIVQPLRLQRSVGRAGPESKPVRCERYTVADVSKTVAVGRAELQLILAVGLERQAIAKRRACRIQPLAKGKGDPGGVDCPPAELGEALDSAGTTFRYGL